MARIFCLILSLTLVSQSFAQDARLVKNVVYGHLDGMAMVYDVEIPPEPNGQGIVYVVSGGSLSGADNLNVSRPFWEFLLEEGYTLFELYHPGMPTYKIPDAYAGAKQGLTHIVRNAGDYGIDGNNLGILGVSSGGHLALLLSLDDENNSPGSIGIRAVVAIMAPADISGDEFDQILFGASPMDFDPALIPSHSPINLVTPDDPPTLLIHGVNDAAVSYERHSVRMNERLVNSGVATELLPIEAGHEVFPGTELGKARAAILDWYALHLD